MRQPIRRTDFNPSIQRHGLKSVLQYTPAGSSFPAKCPKHHTVERRRVELPTSALRTCESPVVTDSSKALTPTLFPVCTKVCTSEPESDNAGTPDADPLAKLAVALLTLSPADRERLAALLTGHQGESEGKAALPPALGSFPTEKPNQGLREQSPG